MGAVQRTEAVTVRVPDPAAAVSFYTDVMGLVEIAREGSTTYLGCGMDENFDLAVVEGEPGVERFAVRVTAEEFERHQDRLDREGIDHERRTDPGHDRGLYLDLPESGVTLGFVAVADTRYHHSGGTADFLDSTAPVDPDRAAIAPTDLDHVAVVSPDVEADVSFLEEVLDFRLSDAQVDEGEWRNAFVRYGLHHHDVALFAGDGPNRLDHVAWAATDVGHMTLFADKLAQRGHRLSKPFTKHGPGANVAFYFHEPGGHRFEYNAGMASVASDAPVGKYEREDRPGGSSMWGAH